MYPGDLTDKEWERLQPLLPQQKPDVGRPAHDHRKDVRVGVAVKHVLPRESAAARPETAASRSA